METFRDHLQYLQKKALEMRLAALKISHKAQFGHTGSMLSMVEIMVALYYGKLYDQPFLQFDPKVPGWEGQDYVVVSKGHAAPVWYSILADFGYFEIGELTTMYQMNSLLQAYPVKKIPGVAISASSVGHGLSGAVGLAMALKMDRLDHRTNRVFCVVGDGELQSGQVWEAALTAAQYKLDNLTVIVDLNGLQADSLTRGVIGIDPVADKFEAFGWKTVPVRDGHNFEDLIAALERALEVQRKPAVILARTISGKGVQFAENKTYYHSAPLSDQEMAVALPPLEQQLMRYYQAERSAQPINVLVD